jgi:hypothetical protein
MLASNPLGFLFSTKKQWQIVAQQPLAKFSLYLLYPLLMAIPTALAWYYGITEIGWKVGSGEAIRLTHESARAIIVLFYLAMIGSIVVIGYLTHWMSRTYNAETSIAKGISIAGFISTPLFFAGMVGFYPVLWLDLVIAIIALAMTVYSLYIGIPIAMKLPAEQGFLYASAILAVAMVIMICIMAGSVILWDFGAAPVFID